MFVRSKSSHISKHICVLAEDLEGTIEPNGLYSVELEPMHRAKEDMVVPLSLVRLTLSTNWLWNQSQFVDINREFERHAKDYTNSLRSKSSVSQFFYLRRVYGVPQWRMTIWIVLGVQPNRHSNKVKQKTAQIKKRRPNNRSSLKEAPTYSPT